MSSRGGLLAVGCNAIASGSALLVACVRLHTQKVANAAVSNTSTTPAPPIKPMSRLDRAGELVEPAKTVSGLEEEVIKAELSGAYARGVVVTARVLETSRVELVVVTVVVNVVVAVVVADTNVEDCNDETIVGSGSGM